MVFNKFTYKILIMLLPIVTACSDDKDLQRPISFSKV